MIVYCIDTSSLIAAWHERYPIENFPSFWKKVNDLTEAGRLIAPIEVLYEMKKRSDELHAWFKAQKVMFRELDEAVQIEATRILARFPRLVGEKKLRTSADPFVIALASINGWQVVTDEKPTGNLQRPHIPDVCAQLNMMSVNLLQVIKSEKWVVG